jgi:hypothetical protein
MLLHNQFDEILFMSFTHLFAPLFDVHLCLTSLVD